MNKQLLKDSLCWGLILWFIGYALSFVLFAFVPTNMLGWIIMPIGTVITLLVLFKKIKADSCKYYLILAIAWTLIAIIMDYIFIVKLLNPTGGYYKLDIYVYYALTFALPLIAGGIKKTIKKQF